VNPCIAPSYPGYVTSFSGHPGVVWLNHHALFHFSLKRVDRNTLTLNLILLMCVAFIPYSTISNYGKLQPVIAFYGYRLTGMDFQSALVLRSSTVSLEPSSVS